MRFLNPNRFRAIYQMLQLYPSWEIEGEVCGGIPILRSEIEFVISKTGGNIVINNLYD